MRIAFLAFRNVVHTVRWVNALSEHVDELHLISSHKGGDPIDPKVITHQLPFSAPHGYFLNYFKLKSLLEEIEPDLLNTHFASGYGTLARLSNFTPNILSVWGTDVYGYPEISPIHRQLVKSNLKNADWVCSTSQVMAERTKEIYPVNNISVTPFGIDVEKFKPSKSKKKAQ